MTEIDPIYDPDLPDALEEIRQGFLNGGHSRQANAVLNANMALTRMKELEAALTPFANVLRVYGKLPEQQLVLLSEDNPKSRRLAHLLPDAFYKAQSLIGEDHAP